MKKKTTNSSEAKFEVLNNFGDFSVSSEDDKWVKSFKRVSWNTQEPKYDIRNWNDETGRPGRGVTLTLQELYNLYILIGMELRYMKDKLSIEEQDFLDEIEE